MACQALALFVEAKNNSGGSDDQKEQILPRLAAGELTLALALEESHHHCPTTIATLAVAQGDKYIINGRKTFVLDGHSANKLIVVTRTSGEHKNSRKVSTINALQWPIAATPTTSASTISVFPLKM